MFFLLAKSKYMVILNNSRVVFKNRMQFFVIATWLLFMVLYCFTDLILIFKRHKMWLHYFLTIHFLSWEVALSKCNFFFCKQCLMVNAKTFVLSVPEVNDPPHRHTTDILSGFFRATGFSPFCVHFLSSLTFQNTKA